MYLVFGGKEYYPDGGWDDFMGKFSSSEEAINYIINVELDYTINWAHVVDFRSMEIINRFQLDFEYNKDTAMWRVCEWKVLDLDVDY
jgi:hypothetical protein